MNYANKLKKGTLALLFVILITPIVMAQPTGTDITHIDTDMIDAIAPAERTDDGGTINTLVIEATQQNPRWKAYVGNITGTLTLDDSGGNTIFNWALEQTDITGEVYSSRSDAVSWESISCASLANINSEESFLGMSSTSADSIENTFNETTHPAINIGTIPVSDCPATSTYVNNAPQDQEGADFPIILLEDGNDNLIYTTPINPMTTGYDGSSLFDFQAILANNPSETTPYFFYVELSS